VREVAQIPHAGSRWRRGKAHGTVEKVWQQDGQWLVRVKLDHGTEARMDAAEFLKQFRHVAEAAQETGALAASTPGHPT
jgi:hypothetical protein